MNQLLLTLISLLALNSYAQLTYVPDDAFEAWIENTISGASNGNLNDNYVNTLALNNTIFPVNPSSATYQISDLTGIEEFSNTTYISIEGMQVTNIDLSSLNNAKSKSLNIESCPFLTNINLSSNKYVFTGIHTCPSLININYPIGFTTFGPSGTFIQISSCNSIQNIDLSNITVSSTPLILIGGNSSLTSLNLANGSCVLYSQVNLSANPQLFCVQVDNPAYSEVSTVWFWNDKSTWESNNPGQTSPYYYVNTGGCSLGIGELNNKLNQHVRIVDLMGRETPFKPNTVLIYVYDDGTTERVFKLEE